MTKYKIGDKVKIRSWDSLTKEYGTDSRGGIDMGISNPWFAPGMKEYCGRTLTIKEISASGAFQTEEAYDTSGYHWWFGDSMVETTNPSIVIYANGNKVIAVDKSTGKTAEALCDPDDKFDFYTGASIAYERLRGRMAPARVRETKPKYFTGEVICTYSGGYFTKGKIYKVKDGVITKDSGYTSSGFESVEKLNSMFVSKFIEVKR